MWLLPLVLSQEFKNKSAGECLVTCLQNALLIWLTQFEELLDDSKNLTLTIKRNENCPATMENGCLQAFGTMVWV